MKRFMKARKSGFTLVELLIVIMIIAILAGMMMLATGSATDSANATKLVNDLRAAKSAALLIYMDEGQNWTWAADGDASDAAVASFDRHMDRQMFGDKGQYNLKFKTGVGIGTGGGTTQPGTTATRTLIGFEYKNKPSDTLAEKIEANAERAGLYDADGNYITKDQAKAGTVYMILY